GRTDFAVWRPSNGTWYVFLSASSATATAQLGAPGDIPIPLDTGAAGAVRPVVYRPSTGQWFIYTGGAPAIVQLGAPGDVPALQRPRLPSAPTSDFDGDGRSDISVYRPANGTWYIKLSSTNFASFLQPQFGLSTDVRVPGD